MIDEHKDGRVGHTPKGMRRAKQGKIVPMAFIQMHDRAGVTAASPTNEHLEGCE